MKKQSRLIGKSEGIRVTEQETSRLMGKFSKALDELDKEKTATFYKYFYC